MLDADAAAVKPIATFSAEQLETMFQAVGGKTTTGQNGSLAIPNGRTVVLFDRGSPVPDKLVHRLITTEASARGAVIATRHTSLHMLGPPLEGPDWLAARPEQ